MGEFKGTPGPWVSDRGFRDAGGPPVGHYTVDDDFLSIFMGEDACEDFDPSRHDYAEVYGPNQEANARLIASAPDLLEALGMLYERNVEAAKSGYTDKVALGLLFEANREARAAIRKATEEG